MGRRCLFGLDWSFFYWWCHSKNTSWGRCLRWPPHLFLFGWLKVNLILLLHSWDWFREMNAGGSFDYCWCLSFFGFVRPNQSPWGYMDRCSLIALCRLIVRRPNFEVATKRLLHQHVKILSSFSVMLRMEVCPCSYFQWCVYFWGLWVSFVTTDEFLVRIKNLLQGLVSHELTVYLSVFDLF